MTAFTAQPILRFMWNSFVVAALSTVLCVFVGALAAYALTRLRMPQRNLIMSLLLAVAMFPLISLMVPLFKLMRELGLLNTYLALILPYAVLSLPVCTLVMASFFQDIPPDLEAAAMIDGCSRVGALFKVVIPLSAPGVFTAAILAFVNAWDEFLLALTMMNRVNMRTLSVGITLYQGEFAFPWPLISAALDHRHRADLHPDRGVPGARRRRTDHRRREGLVASAVFRHATVCVKRMKRAGLEDEIRSLHRRPTVASPIHRGERRCARDSTYPRSRWVLRSVQPSRPRPPLPKRSTGNR